MKRQAAPIIAAILLLLPVLYVGSYLALVVPKGYLGPPFGKLGTQAELHYRVLGHDGHKVFWPLEQIDRKVRPGAWRPAEEDVHFPPPLGNLPANRKQHHLIAQYPLDT